MMLLSKIKLKIVCHSILRLLNTVCFFNLSIFMPATRYKLQRIYMHTYTENISYIYIHTLAYTENTHTHTHMHTLSIYLRRAAAAESLQSCLTLGDPIDGSPPGSAVPGILQARTPEWVAISSSSA